jgi:hypothetical protein
MIRWIRRDPNLPSPLIDGHYFRFATEYYVAARTAWLPALGTVTGNLFHHAIEMYLKGDLSREESPAHLRRYGHNLKRLWKAYIGGGAPITSALRVHADPAAQLNVKLD